MLNYEVEPSLLSRYVPPGTVLDSFQGRTYVSLVGFRFCHTKLLGCFPVPFHANFDEVVTHDSTFAAKNVVMRIEEELFLLPRWFRCAQLQPPLASYTGRTIKHFPMRHRIEQKV